MGLTGKICLFSWTAITLAIHCGTASAMDMGNTPLSKNVIDEQPFPRCKSSAECASFADERAQKLRDLYAQSTRKEFPATCRAFKANTRFIEGLGLTLETKSYADFQREIEAIAGEAPTAAESEKINACAGAKDALQARTRRVLAGITRTKLEAARVYRESIHAARRLANALHLYQPGSVRGWARDKKEGILNPKCGKALAQSYTDLEAFIGYTGDWSKRQTELAREIERNGKEIEQIQCGT